MTLVHVKNSSPSSDHDRSYFAMNQSAIIYYLLSHQQSTYTVGSWPGLIPRPEGGGGGHRNLATRLLRSIMIVHLHVASSPGPLGEGPGDEARLCILQAAFLRFIHYQVSG